MGRDLGLASSVLGGSAGPDEMLNRRPRHSRVGGTVRLPDHINPAQVASDIVMDILDAEECSDFPRAVCRAIYEHLTVHRVSFGRVHRRLGRLQASYWPPMAEPDEARMLAAFGRHFSQHPRFVAGRELDDLSNLGRLGVASWHDVDPEGRFFETDLYREFYEPDGITDQLTLTLTSPEQLAVGMAVDRAGGRFTNAEKTVLRTVQHCLDAVFKRLGGSHLEQTLRAIGWIRIVAEPTGEVIEYDARDGYATLPPGESLTTMPWWHDVRTALAEEPILSRGAAPVVQTLTGDQVKIIVERPLVGYPVIYLFEDGPSHVLHHTSGLTRRQREVAELLVAGLSAKRIAEQLYISAATARSHIEHVYRRLGVNNRAQAVALLLGNE